MRKKEGDPDSKRDEQRDEREAMGEEEVRGQRGKQRREERCSWECWVVVGSVQYQ